MIAQSLRYWLADLISGGALTAAHADITSMSATTTELLADAKMWQGAANEGWSTATLRLIALQDIAAMETPKANATVKRMARTAREAVK